MKRFLLTLTLLLWSIPAWAQAQAVCGEGATCVSDADMKAFITLLEEKKCLQTTQPTIQLDPVTVVVDKDGRVYYSGADPKPYTLKLSWCTYELIATGKVALTVAKNEPPVWGFRFRPKFAGSYLFVDGFSSTKAIDGVDVGILWDFLYYKSVNLNASTGFRSIGGGVGLDLFKNMTLYGGYAFSWWTLKHNPSIGIGFTLW
jgi:hypothetical protein